LAGRHIAGNTGDGAPLFRAEGRMQPETPRNPLLACLLRLYWRLRGWSKDIWQIVYLIRFSIVLALILVVFCVWPEQSRESFRKLAEDFWVSKGRAAWLFVGLFAFVIVSWYWSRVSINLLAPATMKAGGLLGWGARNLPRLAAIFPLLGIAVACFVATRGSDSNNPLLMAAAILLLAVAAYLFFHLRRRYLDKRERAGAAPAAAPRGIRELPRLGKIIIYASLLVSLALIILFSSVPGFAWNFGASAILAFWATTMVSIGTLLAYWGTRYKFPIVGLLVVLGVVFSWFNLNDNHEIRPPQREASAAPPDFGAAFEEWLKQRGDLADYAGKDYPVFIVAAQGGGIRAAYETAYALGRLQDSCPSFAQHVLAISGVSGGSLGAGVFAGLAEQHAKNGPRKPCSPTDTGQFQDATEKVLKEDLLSPPLAAALYPDLLQRILPFPIGKFDRARGLETGFEQAWRNRDETGGNEFAENFHDLADNFAAEATPALFLNTTNVASGLRMVLAHLHPTAPDFGELFVTEQEVKAGLDMPLSTAMGLSARFPIVTPAGTITAAEGKARFVDGGYYENSGTVTVQSILSYFLRKRPGGLQPVRFVVITVGTDACVDERSDEEAASCRKHRSPIFSPARSGLGELLSPFRAIFNTRGGRGLGAVEDLKQFSAALAHQASLGTPPARGGFDVIPLEITRSKVAIPLGWEISGPARQAIRDQFGVPAECKEIKLPSGKDPVNNALSLGCIQALLEGRL
jgi:patatin-like phospholipase